MGCHQSNNTDQAVLSKSVFVLTNKNEIYNDYQIGQKLGKGSFGEVRECLHKASGQKRAVKIMKKRILESETYLKEMLKSELDILRQLDHPNVMKIFETYEDDNNIYIVTEILNGGEIFQKLMTMDNFNEKLTAEILEQVLRSLSYCHGKGIAHRDLKPENIMLESKGGKWFVKLVDFGFAKFYDPEKRFNELLGSPMYMAPEIVANLPYDESCDVWSLGIIAYIMLSGEMPFVADSQKQLFEIIKTCKFTIKDHMSDEVWNDVSEEGKKFLLRMLVKDPVERPKAGELLQDNWIQKHAENGVLDRQHHMEILKNLKNHKTQTQLQQAIMMYMAHNLVVNKDIEKLREVFKRIDTSGDGLLSKEELQKGYKEFETILGSEDEIDELINNLDSNKNGVVDYSEFITATMNQEMVLDEKNLRIAFDVFDLDKNGYITKNELEELLNTDVGNPKLGKKLAEQMIKEGDKDKDKKLSFSEFKDAMKIAVTEYQKSEVKKKK